MKRKHYLFAILPAIILLIMSFNLHDSGKYYYFYNEKIYLNELNNKLIVRFAKNQKCDLKRSSLYEDLKNMPIEWVDDSTVEISIDPTDQKITLEKLIKNVDVKTCNPFYVSRSGFEVGVTDEFLVKFKENVSQSEIYKMNKKYNVEVIKRDELYQLLKVPKGEDALKIANLYQESRLTRFSHPNFKAKLKYCQVIPNDQFFANQFYLNNTGQVFTDGHSGTNDADIDAPQAWTLTKGNSSIIIAVIDQGVTSNHPDLPNTRQVRLNGSNFGPGDSNNPSPTGNNNHGNACAGIIAATQNNSEGISGIAPNCRIMPVRIDGLTFYTDDQKIADAIKFAWQNGAAILSCSWRWNQASVIQDAIQVATTQGRSNKGSVVVFAAGNTADHLHGDNGFVEFPANVNIPGVLTVGASDRNDLQANYSPTSNIIDIAAPSHRAYSCQIATETFEVWTIDIPGNEGYNPVHDDDCGTLPVIGSILPNTGTNNLSYTARMGGTSAACPQVAAVAALILSVNPNLTQQQVFNILTTTCDRVGGYTYTNNRCNELGFGRLNACRAVLQAYATVLSVSGPSLLCSSGTYSVNGLPSGVTISWAYGPYLYAGNGGSNWVGLSYSSGNGVSWVRATINAFGFSSVLPTKNIWVSKPPVPEFVWGTTLDMTPGETLRIDVVPNYYVEAQIDHWTYANGSYLLQVPNPIVRNTGVGYIGTNVSVDHAASIGGHLPLNVTSTNTCGTSSTATMTINVISGKKSADEPIEVDGNILPVSFSLNPNPTTGWLEYSIKGSISYGYTLLVYNEAGILLSVTEKQKEQLSGEIDLSNQPAGVYLIMLNIENQSYQMRIVKE
jgi:subtilisin family serine protease